MNYIWKQVFPMGKVVRVHHAYRPFVSRGPGEWGRARISQHATAPTRTSSTFGKNWRRAPGNMVQAEHVSYILKTGNTWKRGINNFTLNAIKRHPAEIVSLCFPGTSRQIDADTFQVRLSNSQPSDAPPVDFGNIDGSEDYTGLMSVPAQ
ncbi:DUF4424 family protein [Massilia atriviolacea]